MSVGSSVRNRLARVFYKLVMTGLFLGFTVSVHAIDNPDAPDYVDDFENRAQVYELGIQQTAHTTQGYIAAYAAYENFLDQELNSAYTQLIAQLSNDAQHALKISQRKWLRYRDQEFDFIALNWTTAHFGSASVISRGGYRTMIIKNRITLLLNYLQNY